MDILTLYAHAIAMEREAVERYSELAARMEKLENEAVAQIFAMHARLELTHLRNLMGRAAGLALPKVPPQPVASWDGVITPRQALEIALACEERAAAFFEGVMLTSRDPLLRAVARELAADEVEHIVMLESLLERTAWVCEKEDA